MFAFDWTINLSNVSTLLGMLIGVVGLYYGVKGQLQEQKYDIAMIKHQVSQMSESFKNLSSILTQVAVQDTRLTMLEQNIHELRHGQGFVK